MRVVYVLMKFSWGESEVKAVYFDKEKVDRVAKMKNEKKLDCYHYYVEETELKD